MSCELPLINEDSAFSDLRTKHHKNLSQQYCFNPSASCLSTSTYYSVNTSKHSSSRSIKICEKILESITAICYVLYSIVSPALIRCLEVFLLKLQGTETSNFVTSTSSKYLYTHRRSSLGLSIEKAV